MDPLSRLALAVTMAFVLAKYLVLIAIQGRGRVVARTFRWPEDATAFRGALASGAEAPAIERAQAALRNDGESQPAFLVLATIWVMLGARGSLAAPLLATWAFARALHTYALLRPRQPLRNRVFALGLLVTLVIAVDVVRRALP